MSTQTRREVIGGDLVQVVDYGTDEALGVTTEDIEIEIDEDTTDQEVSTQRRRIRRRSYNEANLNVGSLISSDEEVLAKTGIIDPDDNGRVIFDEESRTWEDGALLRIYDGIENVEDAADVEPDQVVLCEDVEWSTSGIDYSGDFVEVELEGMIHGDIYTQYDEEGAE